MKGLTLPIFEHTSDTRNLKDAGLDYSYEDCKISEFTFYNINLISNEKDGDKIYTCIHSNGDVFISSLSPNEVLRLISIAYHDGLL